MAMARSGTAPRSELVSKPPLDTEHSEGVGQGVQQVEEAQMFVQVITAPVGDADAIKQATAKWETERRPQVKGFLGSTSGISAQGTFVIVARFESEELARKNSDDPAQTASWNELSKGFSGPATFHDCSEVDVYGSGGSDEAGFVQVIQGRARDKQAIRNMGKEFEARMTELRPDLLGSLTAWDGDFYTDVIYFTDEAAARAGESMKLPAEMQASMEQWQSLSEGTTFFDLKEPRLVSA